MAPNPHLAEPAVLAGAPLAQARAAGILVHGRDQGPEVMLDLAERVALPVIGYVLPVAAERSWYPGRFCERTEENEPWFSDSLAAIDAAVEQALAAGLPAERIVPVGFSQGAVLVAELVARRPRRYGGVALLTGSLFGPPEEQRRLDPLPGMPVHLASSRIDEWIPIDYVQRTARAFEEAGARVTLEVSADPEHHIDDAAVAAVRALLEGAAEGSSSAGR
jgi:phospholipase/carboxylesterase